MNYRLARAASLIEHHEKYVKEDAGFFYNALRRAGVNPAKIEKVKRYFSIDSAGFLPKESKDVRILALGLIDAMDKTGDL